MPYGYVIAHIDVTNPDQMAEYRQWSTPTPRTPSATAPTPCR